MMDPEGGFYSAYDADSEGVEGKYYTWSKTEIEELLGEEDSRLFCNVYDISDSGNWEHTNILWLSHNFENAESLLDNEFKQKIAGCKTKLLAAREKRIHPQLDDKIILGWNALMIGACCKAFAALGDTDFLKMAEDNVRFLEEKLFIENVWQHSWKNDKANHTAFLDDYTYLLQAYIQLQEVTGNSSYLVKAKAITEYVLTHFSDENTGMFYYTPDYQADVVLRKTEIYDGATPSGNSVMAANLHYLSLVFDKPEWMQMSQQMLQNIIPAAVKYPTSFGVWTIAYQNMVYGMNEIVIVGENSVEQLHELQQNFIANKVIQAAKTPAKDTIFALLNGKAQLATTAIYVCKNMVCKQPVYNIQDALALLS